MNAREPARGPALASVWLVVPKAYGPTEITRSSAGGDTGELAPM